MPATNTVKWDTVEPWRRVVAAIIATNVKLDIGQVALHFGASRDTVDNALRKPRQEAKRLQELVKAGDNPDFKSSPHTPKTTRKTADKASGVASNETISGRVTKPAQRSKKNRTSTEMPESFDEYMSRAASTY